METPSKKQRRTPRKPAQAPSPSSDDGADATSSAPATPVHPPVEPLTPAPAARRQRKAKKAAKGDDATSSDAARAPVAGEVLIAGLPRDADEALVRSLFEAAGISVERVKVLVGKDGKCRGKCFATVGDLDGAIGKLDGSSVPEHKGTLVVFDAAKKPEKAPVCSPGCAVHINNIPPTYTPEKIEIAVNEMCKRKNCAEPKQVYSVKGKGFALAVFRSPVEARAVVRACNGCICCGRKISATIDTKHSGAGEHPAPEAAPAAAGGEPSNAEDDGEFEEVSATQDEDQEVMKEGGVSDEEDEAPEEAKGQKRQSEEVAEAESEDAPAAEEAKAVPAAKKARTTPSKKTPSKKAASKKTPKKAKTPKKN
eukprot:m51a1_g6265 hypothetical protein (367) ;mRNA; r:134450-135944